MSCAQPITHKVLCLQLLLWMFVVHQLHVSSSSSGPSCSPGLEYDCNSRQGNGTACVSGCNITVTKFLSPDYCQNDCCKVCYSSCQECFYMKILSFEIYGSINFSSTNHLLDKTSTEYQALDHNIRTSLFDVLVASNHSVFKIELLQVNWYSPNQHILVYVKITSRKKTSETAAINIIQNAIKTGQLAGLTVSPDVFDVMTENQYDLLKNDEGEKDHLDVVELIAACIGALIILAAICWCFFYMCTTPHQRNRCNPCHRTSRITDV